MKQPGYFLISLDFELMWGMFDKVSTDSYGKNILGVQAVIPELLAIFSAYDIHATWATVGMLTYPNAHTLHDALPLEALRPKYNPAGLSSYRHYHECVVPAQPYPRFYFAPNLVQMIVDTPGQELASHTFSHYYCLDGGENSEAIFATDCQAMNTAAQRFGITPTSIVFPRNQTTPTALKVCQAFGVNSYRGTESHFLYQARKEQAQTNPFIRGLRLLDHYLNLSGYHTYALPAFKAGEIINLKASRFLRPYSSTLHWVENMRLRRIKNAMTHAAKSGQVFHLWWHPHNFGSNRKENLANLLVLLNHFKKLQQDFGMESKNMQELATLVRAQFDETMSASATQSGPK